MPCDASHCEHTAREAESGRVLELFKEISGQPFDHDNPNYYGVVATLDTDTARLCEWCRTHDVTKQSLELQLWWQQHQKHDAARERAAALKRARAKLKAEARAKLTDEEFRALQGD
jgi:hypothetical protein